MRLRQRPSASALRPGAIRRIARAWRVFAVAALCLADPSGPAAQTIDIPPNPPNTAPITAPPPASETKSLRLPVTVRSEDMSLLLEIRLNDLILAEAMPGYINDGSIMLPLRDLAAALDFPVAVDSRAGRASGWFLRENNLFSLDVATGEAIIAGKVQPFGPGLTEIHETDIYVDARLLASWFPIDITYDLAEQLVFLKSREPLPVEQRLAREQKRDRLLRGDRSKRDLPPVAFPREPGVGLPMGDFSFQSGMDVSPDGNADTSQRFGAVLTNEMFGFNGHLALAGDNRDKISDARFRLERKDTNGDVFGENLVIGPH